MRLAITGARGKLGRAVVAAALGEGREVVAVDHRPASQEDQRHPNLSHVLADVTSYAALREAVQGSQALIHLAAYPSPIGHRAHEVHNLNVVASYNALQVALDLGTSHVCQASSVNAIGGAFSRQARYDYFPLDEDHPSYNEDPYSLSKWICEAQADSVARYDESITIASLRLHRLVTDREDATAQLAGHAEVFSRELWGYTSLEAAARACLASVDASWKGHQVFYVVAPRTAADRPTGALCAEFYPNVRVSRHLEDFEGLYDCSKAARLLGWSHDPTPSSPSTPSSLSSSGKGKEGADV